MDSKIKIGRRPKRFKVGDKVEVLRSFEGIEEGSQHIVTCVSYEKNWDGDMQYYIGFLCPDYDGGDKVRRGEETNFKSNYFKLITDDYRKDYTCSNPINTPAIGVKLP